MAAVSYTHLDVYKRQVVGLVIAVAGGSIIQHLGMNDQVADFVRGEAVDAEQAEAMTKRERVSYALEQTGQTLSLIHISILPFDESELERRSRTPKPSASPSGMSAVGKNPKESELC